MRIIFTAIAIYLLAGCISTGTAEKNLGDNLWEIRAWNGKQCKSGTPRANCDEALMPIIKDRATFICGNKTTEVDKCQRRDGASGDRIYCLARCLDKV